MRALLSCAVLGAVLAAPAAGCCRNAAAPHADAAPAASLPRRVVPGEYLFTVTPGTTASSLRSSLADLAPRRVEDLGRNEFLVVFGDDPGLSRLDFRVGNGQILAIQPNVVYRTPPR